MTAPLCLLTPTWAPDAPHFSLLRASLERSAFARTPHFVAVQGEDLEAFRPHAHGTVTLMATGDVLPGDVESERRRAQRRQARAGRHLTRLLGSLYRQTGRPRWVARTGWHVQQITKLAFVAASDIDHVVAIDSDVVVTDQAAADDFVSDGRIVCFTEKAAAADVSRKVRHWNERAERLFDRSLRADTLFETYFDTPFVFHAPTVREMLAWLERRYHRPWWEVLLRQPPRRWSEFGTYRSYLRFALPQDRVDWRRPDRMRYLFDASDPQTLRDRVAELLEAPGSHYVTIHSQSSGRRPWDAADYIPLIRPLIERDRAAPEAISGDRGQ